MMRFLRTMAAMFIVVTRELTARHDFATNFEQGGVTTYKLNGTQTTPTIVLGTNNPAGVAVDMTGKIYVTNFSSNNVTIYKPNGHQTPKTITTGLSGPIRIAIH
jgi:YVTN family beta-propeller protein